MGSLEIVLGRLKIVVDIVVDRCGSFRVLVTTGRHHCCVTLEIQGCRAGRATGCT